MADEREADERETADDAGDDAMFAEHSGALADAIEEALPGWVVRCVEQLLSAWEGKVDPELRARAEAAGSEAREIVGGRIRQLLAADIDDQATTPLALLRGAVAFPTTVLRDHGVPPVVRDEFTERSFPDDIYGLSPASFADVDPALTDLGLAWGAAKAHTHLRRRRRRERT